MRYWDNGFGRLWLYVETMGPLGLIRAETWEEAFETAQDEIMDGCTWSELQSEYGLTDAEMAEIEETGDLPEGAQWRSNGEPSNDGVHGCICIEDLSGCDVVPQENWGSGWQEDFGAAVVAFAYAELCA